MSTDSDQAHLRMTIAGPGERAATDRDWSFVVMVSNYGPDPLSDVRAIEMPPAGARLVSARPSQGECSLGTSVMCDLGSLAAGSEAFVIVTIHPTDERDFVSTGVVSARAGDGTKHETSALTTTRAIRYLPALTLRRPDGETTFRIGRNNTIQWVLRGVDGGVSIDLSRDDGATWTRLTDEVENVGFYDWTGVSPTTSRARIRVSSVTMPELVETSPAFSIAAR